MSETRPLEGKTALITAGAGAIARASASLLLRDGALVVLMGRRLSALEETRDRLLQERPGGRIELVAGDARDEQAVRDALATTHALAGRLDILVPTVGGGGFRPMLMMDAQTLRDELDYNIVSTFLAVRYGVPLMQPGGAIVCISSTAAKMPFAYLSGYHTAKTGLEGFVRAAAEELGSAGIRINAVRPGMTRSASTNAMFETPAIADAFLKEFPLGRLGEPEDIAEAVRFLAGPESSWITGQSIAVDGGNELRKNPDLTEAVTQMFGRDAIEQVRQGKSPG